MLCCCFVVVVLLCCCVVVLLCCCVVNPEDLNQTSKDLNPKRPKPPPFDFNRPSCGGPLKPERWCESSPAFGRQRLHRNTDYIDCPHPAAPHPFFIWPHPSTPLHSAFSCSFPCGKLIFPFLEIVCFPSFSFLSCFPSFCRLTFQNVFVNIWPNLVSPLWWMHRNGPARASSSRG